MCPDLCIGLCPDLCDRLLVSRQGAGQAEEPMIYYASAYRGPKDWRTTENDTFLLLQMWKSIVHDQLNGCFVGWTFNCRVYDHGRRVVMEASWQ